MQRSEGAGAPGKRSLVEHVAPVQRRASGAAETDAAHQVASSGVQGAGGALPHLDAIQGAFGHHDVRGVSAHVGGRAAESASALGAEAYATGNDVAFRQAPDLHTAAHEAAHVVQQRAGVQLKGGFGEAGDVYEQHADAVADRVVRGESAQGLLDEMAPSPGASGGAAQRSELAPRGEAGARLRAVLELLRREAAVNPADDPEAVAKREQLRAGLPQLEAVAGGDDEALQAQACQALIAELAGQGVAIGDLAAPAPAAPAPASGPAVQRVGGGAASAVIGAIQAHPVAAVITGLALVGGWLYVRRQQQQQQQRLHQTLAANFNATPMTPPSKDEVFPQLRQRTAAMQMSDLPVIREYCDFLGQYVNDAMMKTGDLELMALKIPITEAAPKFHQAFFAAVATPGAGATLFREGCQIINGLDAGLYARLQLAVRDFEKLKPNQREVNGVNHGSVDLASMMLAKAVHKDGFQPQVVIGLPSGGGHVASRITGTLAAITGTAPVMWLSRPRTVKPERAGLMDDVPTHNILQGGEVAHILEKLGRDPHDDAPVRALVVDDGQASGKTLELAIQIYQQQFGEAGVPLQIRGGISFGGMAALEDQLSPTQDNFADYVVMTSFDSAGDRRALRGHDVQDTLGDEVTNKPTSTMDTQVNIFTESGVTAYRGRDLLTTA